MRHGRNRYCFMINCRSSTENKTFPLHPLVQQVNIGEYPGKCD